MDPGSVFIIRLQEHLLVFFLYLFTKNKVTQILIGLIAWLNQSEVALLSNASKYRKKNLENKTENVICNRTKNITSSVAQTASK